jgi:hypothetical protein
MLKDSTKYASTDGWGLRAGAGGDPKKPLVTDAVTGCFECHVPQKGKRLHLLYVSSMNVRAGSLARSEPPT